MAEKKIKIPDLKFAMFYPEIFEQLQAAKLENAPELSDENPLEVSNQLISLMAAQAHVTNGIADVIANESMLSTARRLSTVRNILKDRLGYTMAAAKPADADMVAELSSAITAGLPKTIIQDEATFSTEADAEGVVVPFYSTEEVIINKATDNFTTVIVNEQDSVNEFLDITTKALSPTTPADDVAPFTSVNKVGDAIYFGHEDVMFTAPSFNWTTENLNIQGVWEFYDGDFEKDSPDNVTQVNQILRFEINNYLGSASKAGTRIRVKNNTTKAFEDVTSIWDGSKNIIETSTLLLQSTVSTVASEYTIGAEWEELTTDDDKQFAKDGLDIVFELPQNQSQNWRKTKIKDEFGVETEAFWIRFRLTEKIVGTLPVLQNVLFASDNVNSVRFGVTQGIVQTDAPLGSSDGSPNQEFLSSKSNFIDDGSDVFKVSAVAWTRVDDFLSSTSIDEHYVVELIDDNQAKVITGNGRNGKIPPAGVNNLSFEYKYGAENDGNVAANTIISANSGTTSISDVFNPRNAAGWREAEGSTEESLELAKINGSKHRRIIETALNSDDVETIASTISDNAGNSKYSRVVSVTNEESPAFGFKTLRLIVVKRSGEQATIEELDELDLYFNGDKTANPPVRSHLVSGQKLFSENYKQKVINIDVSVSSKTITPTDVTNKLKSDINPEATDGDNNFIWNFGDTVTLSKISHFIHEISTDVVRVDFTSPASDISLGINELPIIGSVSVTIT